jgi:hypothetical protein
MTGAGAVLTLVLVPWAAGSIITAAWSQTWGVVTRGHFRIVGWAVLALAVMGAFSSFAATPGLEGGVSQRLLALLFAGACGIYLLAQYSQSDPTAATIGYVAGGVGFVSLVTTAGLLDGWPILLSATGVFLGAGLLGAVTNGMLLGHWYLNQPGLKPWALERLTTLGLIVAVGAAAIGGISATRLIGAPTEGAALGLPGSTQNLGPAFFFVWLGLVLFTAAVVYMARRCVTIRSIQSATGLYYVAILTAGVAEFLVRYLMVNAT